MKLFGRTKNCKNATSFEVDEVVLVKCNLLHNSINKNLR